MSNLDGKQRISAERKRQIEAEGWTPEHDDEHGSTTLEKAAVCYAQADDEKAAQPQLWPWDKAWWKPKARLRNLERAGALYLAAAEAAQRANDHETCNRLRNEVEGCAASIDSLFS